MPLIEASLEGTYVLLGLCLFAGLGTVFAKSTARRLMGLIGVGLFGVYSLAAGALEEQFRYYTVVVSVLVCATSLAELPPGAGLERRDGVLAGLLAVAAAAGPGPDLVVIALALPAYAALAVVLGAVPADVVRARGLLARLTGRTPSPAVAGVREGAGT